MSQDEKPAEPEERWLWDRTGEPDPEVAALEQLLAPLAHDGRPLRPDPELDLPAPPARPPVSRVLLAALAASLLLVVGLGALLLALVSGWPAPPPLTPPPPPVVPPVPPQAAPPLVVADGGPALRPGEWFTATEAARVLHLSGDLGRLTLLPGTRLQLQRATEEVTRLYLERGELDAFVGIEARPRFFQVETPATTCVDLGCAYTLRVDESGAAVVAVRSGRVVFEAPDGREVYVPTGATCRARKDRGAGTPRFEDAPPELTGAIAAFDAAAPGAADRAGLAAAVLDAVTEPRHSLSAWHLLQDGDPAVVEAARKALRRLLAGGQGRLPTPLDLDEREAWRRRCAEHWPGAW